MTLTLPFTTVRVKRLTEDAVQPPEKFDYVINATGHFSVPNVPEFEGFQKFNGESLNLNANFTREDNFILTGGPIRG